MAHYRAAGIYFSTADILYAEMKGEAELVLWLTRAGSAPVPVTISGEEAARMQAWLERTYSEAGSGSQGFRGFDA